MKHKTEFRFRPQVSKEHVRQKCWKVSVAKSKPILLEPAEAASQAQNWRHGRNPRKPVQVAFSPR